MLDINLADVWGWGLAALLFACVSSVVLVIVRLDKRSVYTAALIGVAPWVAPVATVSTLLAYIMLLDRFSSHRTTWVNDLAVFVGGGTGLMSWLLLAAIYLPFTTATRANTGSHGELDQRLRKLWEWLSLWHPEEHRAINQGGEDAGAVEHGAAPTVSVVPGTGLVQSISQVIARLSPGLFAASSVPAARERPGTAKSAAWDYPCEGCLVGMATGAEHCAAHRRKIAATEVTLLRQSLLAAIEGKDSAGDEWAGLPWVMGTGYINLWKLVHDAEELLIDVETHDVVIRGALEDEARIKGCTMDNGAQLLFQLQTAVTNLSPEAGAYLDKLPVSGAVGGTANGATAPDSGSLLKTNPVCVSYKRELMSRGILRQVRHAINVYRDERRAGLVRARSKLLKTIILTGTVTYGLVALAIVQGASVTAVVAATTFFLVGGLVGLFNRLYQETQTDSAVEDFGLATARLIHAPMFSGLAAVGGVVVTALLAVVLNYTVATTTGATTVSSAGVSVSQSVSNESRLPSLGDIFDLNKNQASIVVAAIFGLTPNLLIQRLTTTAEQYKTELKSSQVLNSPSPQKR
ncbi:MAG: hypothetical protein NVS2B16_22330 [Chloroflexota bacterium]